MFFFIISLKSIIKNAHSTYGVYQFLNYWCSILPIFATHHGNKIILSQTALFVYSSTGS
jgi:hypothetical protein